jgi:MFS family permease
MTISPAGATSARRSERAAAPADAVWTGSFVALLLVNLLLCFGFYMLPPTMPAYVIQIGGSPFQASLVIGTFSITSLAARVISGTVVDALGESRVIIAGIVLIAATTLGFIWSPVSGILLLRGLQGIGWGLSTAAIATAVYKVVPESRRGEGSGYYALTTITAASLTPLVAIVLKNASDIVLVLGVSVALTLAATTLLKSGLSTLPPRLAGPRRPLAITLKSIFEPGALLPSALCFLVSIPLCGVIAYLVLFGAEHHLEQVWIFFIGYALMILATRPFIGRLFDRRGHVVIILPGSVAMLLGLVTLSLTESTALLIVSSLLFGLGYGAVHPSLHAWAVNRCPVDRKAAANGLFLSAIDLGYIVGAIALGFVAELTSFALMYRYSALAIVALIAVYLLELLRCPGPRRGPGSV